MKFLKWLLLGILGIVLLAAISIAIFLWRFNNTSATQLATLGPEAPTLTSGGATYRDLNKNGTLDPYGDTNADLETRVQDLISQMTLEEKAGTMFITMSGILRCRASVPWR